MQLKKEPEDNDLEQGVVTERKQSAIEASH